MKMVDKARRSSLSIMKGFLLMKREFLALLKLSTCPSTLAYHKVSHLSIKDTFKHIEHCICLSATFDLRALSFAA